MSDLDDPLIGSGLSTRALRALEALGVGSIRQMTRCSESDLSIARNTGKKTIAEIQAFLKERGLRLRDDQSPGMDSTPEELAELEKIVDRAWILYMSDPSQWSVSESVLRAERFTRDAKRLLRFYRPAKVRDSAGRPAENPGSGCADANDGGS